MYIKIELANRSESTKLKDKKLGGQKQGSGIWKHFRTRRFKQQCISHSLGQILGSLFRGPAEKKQLRPN